MLVLYFIDLFLIKPPKNTFYIKDLCLGEKNLEKGRTRYSTILISNIRKKYFSKMLQIFSKNKPTVKLELDENIVQRRLTYTIQTCVNNIRFVKQLKVSKITLSSKQFIHFILSGTCLEEFYLKESNVIGPKLKFSCSRTSSLQALLMVWDEISPSEQIRTFSYFETILENLNKCKFSENLNLIFFEKSKLPAEQAKSLELRFIHINVEFDSGHYKGSF
ncbi:unnamed protein product [Moneuplotes crassus]|uniref:Uncharacterized protein n=1 Tax=Euplotes crassus TaxID=5936 RepID=A0AAD1XET3_EUPCR|nr:unnamed protein product [Moneuplotes crassus]